MISLRGVTLRLGGRVVLDGLDLDLAEGQVTALMGPNGSGKTTLARVLLGLTVPDSGQVLGLDGVRRAAVFQEDRLCEQLSAVGNVRLVLPRGTRVADVRGELRRAGLDEDSLAKPVRDLSGGQRRKVAVVRALAPEADLVVLDEPFTGLDVDGGPVVMTYARARCTGRTTLLITHDRAEADLFGARVVELAPHPTG
ncbi:ATP-binding cassette domain-containing protein [Actinotalea sp. K2]|uniref:ATP-binding cassette domain-containing protein n=1 Tax=Actinotalea sp. K2 TaxID=2939438 RepID=UPI00201720D2|nr:ATP-binding cassette domain-containing protein [Actinotalea sp. K2]MCL3859657.1 ATP-binding cassette domain-containing protein [Actinotalea sp. K2]